MIGAVDLFCGAGGLSLGLQWQGIRIAGGIDLDSACRYPYEHGVKAPFFEKDIKLIRGDEIKKLYRSDEISLLAGCAPCQPFSRYNARFELDETKWSLLFEFLRLIQEVNPDLILMENVPDLARLDIWNKFTSVLSNDGYHISFEAIDAVDYGVAQNRRRLVLLGSRLGKIDLPLKKISHSTVRTTIGHLPPIEAGTCHKEDRFHVSRRLMPINLRRIKASLPGGSWKAWPDKLQADCHRSKKGRTYGSVYGRMSWDQASPTITTQFYGFGNGRFGHPEQDRALSLREGALLQSFPADYQFIAENERMSIRTVGRLIGNAVPPILGSAIGSAIIDHVFKTK